MHLKTHSTKLFCLFFSFCTLLLVAGLVFVLLPKATIALKLNTRPFIQDIEIGLDNQIEEALPGLNIIPAKVIAGSFNSNHDIKALIPEDYLFLDGLIEFTKTEKKRALVFSKVDLEEILKIKIQQLIPQNYELAPNSYQEKISVLTYEPDKQQGRLNIHIEAMTSQQIDQELIKYSLKGKNLEQADLYLAKLSLLGYNIKIWPFFWPFMPFSSKRIEIIY